MNLAEVFTRLHRDSSADYLARYYNQYLWNLHKRDPVEQKYHHYIGNWKDLTVGKRYLVSLSSRTGYYGGEHVMHGANIFIFKGYHPHEEDMVEQRKLKIQF